MVEHDDTPSTNGDAAAQDVPSLIDFFHKVENVLPDEHIPLTVHLGTTVADAVHLMKERGATQLLVCEGSEVMGVFSYRSFSTGALRLGTVSQTSPLGQLPVEDFLERPMFTHASRNIDEILPDLHIHGVIAIGTPDRLEGTITPTDIVNHLFRVASPFVLLQEAELAVRWLMLRCAQGEDLRQCIRLALGHKYRGGREHMMPVAVEGMTFGEYAKVICLEQNFPRFQAAFGGSRVRAQNRLETVHEIRNQVFHFRRPITREQYDDLLGNRDWLLRRCVVLSNQARPR